MAAILVPFPSDLAPTGMKVSLQANTSVFSSNLSKIPVTVENPGIRWSFTLEYSDLDLGVIGNVSILEALTRLRGKGNRIQLHNMAKPETTGSLDTSSKVNNGNFFLGSIGWTQSLGTGGKIGFKPGRAKLTKGSVGVPYLSRSIALTSGEVYSAHIAILPGTTDVVTLKIGTSSGGSQTFSSTYTGSGRYEAVFVAGVTNYITVEFGPGGVSGDFVSVGDIRVARASQSLGVNQTGTKIVIDGLPTNASNVLNTLDFVGINGELKRLVDYVDTNSAGEATLIFEPPMKSAVPDNSPIVFNRPFTKMILDSDKVSESIRHPYLSSFSVPATEDLS